MSAPMYETEVLRQVWHNQDGWRIDVGPDRDGTGMVELRYYDKDSPGPINRISFPAECAALIAEAVKACGTELTPPTP